MEAIGILAGFLTLIGYVPQAIKTLRTRSTKDLSLTTFLIIGISAVLWTIYGVSKGLPSIWITNAVVALCSLLVLGIKSREKRS